MTWGWMTMSESYIRKYWDDIESGETLVNYYVRKQMEMLLDEMDSQDIMVDLQESEKRIRFIESECRHSEAPFAGKKFTLMPTEFEIGSGEITPTLKVKRNVVLEKYKELIDRMYVH